MSAKNTTRGMAIIRLLLPAMLLAAMLLMLGGMAVLHAQAAPTLSTDDVEKLERRAVTLRDKPLQDTLGLCRQAFARANDALAAHYLNILGRMYELRGDDAMAELLFEAALAICRKRYGRMDRAEQARALTGAARAHYARRDFKRAGQLFRFELGMYGRLYGEMDHVDFAEGMLDKGIYEADRGDYARAQPLLEGALAMYRRLFHGADHPALARCLDRIGKYYQARGDTARAASSFVEALAMRRCLYRGTDNAELAESIGRMGSLRNEQGDSAGAEKSLGEAMAMLRRLYKGVPHVDLAAATRALGGFYVDHGNDEAARPLLDETLRLYDRLRGAVDHPERANCMRDLAALYGRRHEFAIAGRKIDSAWAMYHRLYGTADYLDLALSAAGLARCAEQFGDDGLAMKYHLEFLRRLPRVTRQSSLFESESRQIAFQVYLTNATHALLRFLLRRGMTEELYNVAVWSKSPVLTAVEWRNRVLAELGTQDSSIAEMRERYQELGQLIPDTRCDADSVQFDQEQARSEELRARAERLEDSLTRKGGALRTARLPPALPAIRKRLRRGECAIEFLRLPMSDRQQADDSALYYALLLRHGSAPPALVPLCSEHVIDALLRYPVEGANDQTSYLHDAVRASKLYRSVWGPLDSLLAGIERVYISPDGLLNRIAFAALRNDAGRMLIDRYDVRWLFSSSDLVPRLVVAGNQRVLSRTAAVFGDVRYDADSAELARIIPECSRRRHASVEPACEAEPLNVQLPRESKVGFPLDGLAGTRAEIEAVAGTLERHAFAVTAYTGADANEEAFEGLASPTVLHVATHGYFFSDPTLPKDDLLRFERQGGVRMIQYAEHPLFRSGLLLAGASRVWALHPPAAGIGDGIVTAYDVAHMNLARTELVVLSACETGLGQIMVAEGVFGLKRAFRAAGARAVMMSLWKVPDQQTRQLMEWFYRNWLDEGQDMGLALTNAQREMAGSGLDPYYWAAFVLVGE